MKCCGRCGRRLVFAAIVIQGFILKAWICDCEQLEDETIPGLVADIRRARALPKDGSVVVNLNKLQEE